MQPPLIVQKYGGATLSDPQKIKNVAQRIARLSQKGTQVVAVVSAMGKTTDQLLDLAQQISANPNRRELDMLLTTGERISMALVSMALHDQGCEAISFTGSQAGVLTDESHLNAFIVDVKAFRVEEALTQGKVVVLAGYQGVSPLTKEITTLGRGGTDTTAVAMASYLKAARCEILKDVTGVCTADPSIIPAATPLPELSYDQLLDMTFWGAKVLHYRSVELAKRNSITLYIGAAADEKKTGTLVTEKGDPMNFESTRVLALNSHESVLTLESKNLTEGSLLSSLRKELDEKQIPAPQILTIQKTKEGFTIYLTGPQELLLALQREIPQSKNFSLKSDTLSSITATCTSSASPALPEKILRSLAEAKIESQFLLMGPMSATVFISRGQRASALQRLHSDFL